jgi:lipopolysaccharide export system permease protein
MAFLWPGYVFAFLVSLTAVWLNDVAASWGERGVRRVVLQSVEQIAYGMLRTQKAYSTKQFSINVVDVQDRKLIRPTLTFHASGDSPAFTLTAETAELRLTEDKTALSIQLTNSEIDWGKDWVGDFPGTEEEEISLTDASRKGGSSLNPADSAMRQIPQRIEEQKEKIRRLKQKYAAEAAYQMVLGDFESLSSGEWGKHRNSIRNAEMMLHRLHTVPWRRWANGFSCLFFVMVGAPLAIRLRNADIWTSFGLCFLPILLVYYPLLMYGLDRAKVGELPPYSVWLGNVVLMVAGCLMVRRVLRY